MAKPVSVDCVECGGKIVVTIEGEYIRATLIDPAEYPYAELVSRDCDTVGIEGYDPCTLNDHEIEENALESLNQEAARFPW